MFTCVAVRTAADEPDRVQLQMLEAHQLPRRWDNVAAEPLWLQGVVPKFDRQTDLHVVRLAPGQSTTLKIPPWEILRISGCHCRLERSQLQILLSNGSGLERRIWPVVSRERQSLLAFPDESQTSLARIRLAETARKPVSFAVFVSRTQRLPDLAPHRNLLIPELRPQIFRRHASLDYATASIHVAGDATAEPWALLRRNQQFSFTVEGPLRLALETRIRWPKVEHQIELNHTLQVYSNDRLHRVVEVESSPENRRVVQVDGCASLVGQHETSYLQFPSGTHRIRLASSVDTYFRILSQDSTDYFVPFINQPDDSAVRQNWSVLSNVRSSWEVRLEDSLQLQQADTLPVQDLMHLASASWKRNQYPDGALRAWSVLRKAAAHRPDAIQVRQAADRVRSRHTFWKDLRPSRSSISEPTTLAWFHVPTLQNPRRIRTPRLLSEQHSRDGLRLLSHALMTRVAETLETAAVYRLPENRSDSLLRISVDRRTVSNSAEILLQFDDRSPISLFVGQTALPVRNHFVPSTSEMAMTQLRHNQHVIDAGTLGGPFGRTKQPAELIPAGVSEFFLPATVKSIRIWSPQCSVKAGLQIRSSKTYSLSEMEFLTTVERLNSIVPNESDFFAKLLLDPQATLPLTTYEACELRNHLIPTARRIASLAGQIETDTLKTHSTTSHAAGSQSTGSQSTGQQPVEQQFSERTLSEPQIIAWPTTGPETGPLPSAANTSANQSSKLMRQAQRLMESRQWIPAIEQYSSALSDTRLTAEQTVAARVGRIRALKAAGESFLASQEQQALLSERPALSLSLLQDADDQENTEAELRLKAADFYRVPLPENQRALAQAFADDGFFAESLYLCLTLPLQYQSPELIVRCAWHKQWWKTFHEYLPSLEPALRATWTARYQLINGQHQQAQATLEQFPETAVLAQHVVDRLAIVSRMKAGDFSSIDAWLKEWQRTPGPRLWKSDDSLIVDSARTDVLESRSLGVRLTAFRANSDRPVRLRVLGPTKLRFEIRPIHVVDDNLPSETALPIDDWIMVHLDSHDIPIPITNNLPSTGLTLPTVSQRPGKKIVREIDVPAGLHSLVLSSRNHPCLIRYEIQQPELPLGILPPPNLASIQAVQQAIYGATDSIRNHDGSRVVFGAMTADRRQLKTHELTMQRRFASGAELQYWPVDAAKSQAQSTEAIRQVSYKDLSPDPVIKDSDYVVRKMEELVFLAENDSTQQRDARVAAEKLFREHADVKSVARLFQRITSRQVWQAYPQILTSAGLRSIPVDGWHPETASLRTRKALTGPWKEHDFPLYRDQGFEAELDDSQPSTLMIRLSMAAVLPAVATNCVVCFRLDDDKLQTVTVVPDEELIFRCCIPPGRHVARAWIQTPIPNQMIRLNAKRILPSDDGGPQIVQNLKSEYSRLYHIASQEEPLIVRVAAPTVIRIDEWRDGQTLSTFEFVQDGIEEITIRPAQGQTEGLFRVFRKVDARNLCEEETPQPESVPLQPDSLASPLIASKWATHIGQTPALFASDVAPLLMKSPDQAAIVELDDALFQLGDQEDPTWSVRTEHVERRPLEEGLSAGDGNEFLQLSLTRRFRSHWNADQHWQDETTRTEFISRFRELAGHSFGLRHTNYNRITANDATLVTQAGAWVQSPLSDFPGSSSTEWAFSGRIGWQQYREVTPKFGHLPAVSLFGRVLSLRNSDLPPNFIDQDVFTTFKANHRLGLRFSDTLLYRPWLDTRWALRGSLVTNEEFLTLDNLSLRAGWDQYLGPLEVSTAYRLTQFLEDTNRRADSLQNVIELNARLDLRFAPRRRFELGFRIQHDIDASSSNMFASLEWFLDNGRDYEDLRSSDSAFLRLRKIRAANRLNPRFVNPAVFDVEHTTINDDRRDVWAKEG